MAILRLKGKVFRLVEGDGWGFVILLLHIFILHNTNALSNHQLHSI